MKKTISKYEFIDEMIQDYYFPNDFTREGLSCLFDYLEELEQETGEELEFDPVALHCQYSEMLVSDFLNNYYDNDDIEAIISANRLKSKKDITADMLQKYEYEYSDNSIVVIVDDNTIIVDTDRVIDKIEKIYIKSKIK